MYVCMHLCMYLVCHIYVIHISGLTDRYMWMDKKYKFSLSMSGLYTWKCELLHCFKSRLIVPDGSSMLQVWIPVTNRAQPLQSLRHSHKEAQDCVAIINYVFLHMKELNVKIHGESLKSISTIIIIHSSVQWWRYQIGEWYFGRGGTCGSLHEWGLGDSVWWFFYNCGCECGLQTARLLSILWVMYSKFYSQNLIHGFINF